MNKRRIILLLILFSMLLLISCNNRNSNQPFDPLTSSIFQRAEVRYVRILANTEVKAGASRNHQTLKTLSPDEVVRVLGKLDDWYVIRFDDFQVGVINSAQTKPVVRDRENPESISPPPEESPEERDELNEVDEVDDEEERAAERPTPVPIPEQTPEADPEESIETPEQDQRNERSGQERNQESQLINLINRERRRYDLPDLEEDIELSRVARVKAQDMIDNNYFSHNSPTYGSPFDMINEYDIDYQYAGENLAKNMSVEQAHQSLMDSSGHRKNILSPDFTHLGVGIKPAEHGFIYVEMFIGVPE
ncbi:MAG: CAP domain-containing protein [bacterium]